MSYAMLLSNLHVVVVTLSRYKLTEIRADETNLRISVLTYNW